MQAATVAGPGKLELPALSFGCASIGNLFYEITDDEAQAVLSVAWENGIRYFDTAPHYGRGLSEKRLGQFLSGRQGQIVSTKVGRVLSPAQDTIDKADGFVRPLQNDVRLDYTADGILECFEQSRARLGLDHIDVLLVHDLGKMVLGPDNERHVQDFLDSGLEAMIALREKGLISAFGLGVNECEVCIDLLKQVPLDVILLAGRFTLLEQEALKALFPLCQDRGTRIVIGGVFNSGILATGAQPGAYFNYAPADRNVLDRVRRIEAICDRHDVPLAAAALNYPRRHPLVASTLIATGKKAILQSNLQKFHQPIPQALWDDLEKAGLAAPLPGVSIEPATVGAG